MIESEIINKPRETHGPRILLKGEGGKEDLQKSLFDHLEFFYLVKIFT